MKKVFVILMCCLGLAFTSCKPDPEPEPEPKPYEQFLGEFLGSIELQGVLTSVMFPGTELPLDGSTFQLGAKIDAGSSDDQVYVTFTVQEENYVTNGTVNGNTIEFGTLSYTYVENTQEFTVHLDLTGTLSDDTNTITLTGPYTGNGDVNFQGITMVMDAKGDVTGTLSRLATK